MGVAIAARMPSLPAIPPNGPFASFSPLIRAACRVWMAAVVAIPGCIAEVDDEYIKAMEDVLEVYERPLSAEEPVVCVDEKPVTLHNDVREPLPMKPGSVAKRDNEYERAGTANVFCGIEPQAGVHFTKVT